MSTGDVVEEGLDLYGDHPPPDAEEINENEVLGTVEEPPHDNDNDTDHNGNGVGVVIKAEDKDGSTEDLFEAALTESSVKAEPSEDGDTKATATKGIYGPINNQQYQGRRYFCYVGNMTWWTTDEDLAGVINGTGVPDLLDIKFYENRQNGQSKGFALTVFASDGSVRGCMEKLPKLSIHGQSLIVLPYTKQAQQQLEAATRKPGEKAPSTAKDNQPNKGPNFMGTVRLGQGGGGQQPPQAGPPMMHRQQGGPMMGGQRPPNLMNGPPHQPPMGQPQRLIQQHPHMQPQRHPHMQMQMHPHHQQPTGPVPLIPPPSTNRPPPGLHQPPIPSLMPQLQRPQHHGAPPPGAYINPHVYRGPGHPGHPGGPGGPMGEPPISEPEFEEIMNRNRTVSSSAISRAVSDAAAGDYASAIETLVTAISLIRQSRVAQDDRCKVLITSLQDTLHGIETKSYGGAGKRGRERRSRSPRDRSSSSKRHRRSSRSRSRSRERYDDYRGGGGSGSRRY